MSFADRVTEMLNAQAVVTTLGIAYRCGVLGALGPEAETAESIAKRAGADARYTKEILAVLVTGNIVVISDGEPPLFSLPEDRQQALTSMGIYFEEVPLLVKCAFDEVSRAAKEGGGVNVDYSPFSFWMGRLADQKHERQLIQHFLPALRHGGVVEMLRKEGATICDIGCGHGTAARLMARAFPTAKVVGFDYDLASVNVAIADAAKEGLTNVFFKQADASKIEEDGSDWTGHFDFVTSFDVIHDLPDPAGALREVKRLLKPKTGVFAMVDIRSRTSIKNNMSHSHAPFLYTISLLHCMPQGLRCGGAGLGTMWGREKATEMLTEAGFQLEGILELEFDTFNDCYLCSAK